MEHSNLQLFYGRSRQWTGRLSSTVAALCQSLRVDTTARSRAPRRGGHRKLLAECRKRIAVIVLQPPDSCDMWT